MLCIHDCVYKITNKIKLVFLQIQRNYYLISAHEYEWQLKYLTQTIQTLTLTGEVTMHYKAPTWINFSSTTTHSSMWFQHAIAFNAYNTVSITSIFRIYISSHKGYAYAVNPYLFHIIYHYLYLQFTTHLENHELLTIS